MAARCEEASPGSAPSQRIRTRGAHDAASGPLASPIKPTDAPPAKVITPRLRYALQKSIFSLRRLVCLCKAQPTAQGCYPEKRKGRGAVACIFHRSARLPPSLKNFSPVCCKRKRLLRPCRLATRGTPANTATRLADFTAAADKKGPPKRPFKIQGLGAYGLAGRSSIPSKLSSSATTKTRNAAAASKATYKIVEAPASSSLSETTEGARAEAACAAIGAARMPRAISEATADCASFIRFSSVGRNTLHIPPAIGFSTLRQR